jgi:hypothetical protein
MKKRALRGRLLGRALVFCGAVTAQVDACRRRALERLL